MSQLQSSLVQEKTYLEEIFKILDAKDGIKDGKIDCKFLLKWLDAQSLNSRIEFEYELALNKYNIASIIQSADSNKDGYIDKQEFMELVLKKVAILSKQQQICTTIIFKYWHMLKNTIFGLLLFSSSQLLSFK